MPRIYVITVSKDGSRDSILKTGYTDRPPMHRFVEFGGLRQVPYGWKSAVSDPTNVKKRYTFTAPKNKRGEFNLLKIEKRFHEKFRNHSLAGEFYPVDMEERIVAYLMSKGLQYVRHH